MRATALAAMVVLAACRKEEPRPDPSRPKMRVEMTVAVPFADVTQQVHDAKADAKKRGRALIVYIGAAWCEPCQRFHKAAEHGELDEDFPTLSLLEYDLDTDGARLKMAGYDPRYIPYFGAPQDDGRASDRAFAGSIQGNGAVENIVPRLKQLLE